jgi:Tol biopolymer transport system component
MLSYSPDGRNIAYTVFDGTDSEIYTIDHNGGTLIQVTNNRREDFEPSWGSLP